MSLVLIVLIPIFLASVWAFFKCSPTLNGNPRVLYFNLGVLVAGLLACAILTLRLYWSMTDGADRAWWPVFAVLGALVVFPMVLLIGGLVRNFWVFRTR